MKATDILWDVDNEEELELLPKKRLIFRLN